MWLCSKSKKERISSVYPLSGTQAKEAEPAYNVTGRVLEPKNTSYIHHFCSYSRMRELNYKKKLIVKPKPFHFSLGTLVDVLAEKPL